jgi:hydrogenase maturation protein HypF
MQRRALINIRGVVQGVGFRPYIYSLAREHNLFGFVLNNTQGVYIEVEGSDSDINLFLMDVKNKKLPHADIFNIKSEQADPIGYKQFDIRESEHKDVKSVPISAELATCADCLSELFDPGDRRYGYPFINCTNCGPRFTIVMNTPYDRKNTTMSEFVMCDQCSREYEDPSDRRFHAQPNACDICGPKLTLLDREGNAMPVDDVITGAARLIKEGHIIAVKGLGGFHFACDATNQDAVSKLRAKKYREYKPFAIMVKDIKAVKNLCEVNQKEENVLTGMQRPVVLLKKRAVKFIAEEIAPHQQYLGVMLPYSPLHHLLLEKSGLVLVMTSGNISSEPIVYKDEEAVDRLQNIADFFIMHNREIHIRTDDSVCRIWQKKEMLLRRSRGYAPHPLLINKEFRSHILACGADLKNVFCLSRGNQVYMSHHIGDLDNIETLTSFEKGISHFKRMFDIKPDLVAYDLHPEYLCSKYAHSLMDIKTIGIQHHHAHIVSCMADNEINEQVIGIAFDGTGYGVDGNIWGGEFLVCDYDKFQRMAHFEYFPLPGGDKAIVKPWRIAASLLSRIYGDDMMKLDIDFIKLLDRDKWNIIRNMIEKNINSPLTSSMGRIFDLVSALLCVRGEIYYEGQAAIELEMIADYHETGEYAYASESSEGIKIIQIDRIVRDIINDIENRESSGLISARFHNTIARIALDMSIYIRDSKGINNVALSGGVFQNMFLLNRIYDLLKSKDFNVYTHQRVPTNDGGIALGQAVIANALKEKREPGL